MFTKIEEMSTYMVTKSINTYINDFYKKNPDVLASDFSAGVPHINWDVNNIISSDPGFVTYISSVLVKDEPTKSDLSLLRKVSRLANKYVSGSEIEVKNYLSKESQKPIIKKVIDSLSFNGSSVKQFNWVRLDGVDNVIRKFIGRYPCPCDCFVDKKDEETIHNAAMKSNGVWYYEVYPEYPYCSGTTKVIVSISDDEITILSGYNGWWTFSGEDYVYSNGKVTILKTADFK